MNQEFWNQIQSKYELGKLIYGMVEAHTPFGVFVNISDAKAKGIIQITDFLDTGAMTPEMYSEIGSPVGAVVIGYTEDDRNQVWLSVKPSVLQKALVKLKLPAVKEQAY
jgi:ribosomal protein S1